MAILGHTTTNISFPRPPDAPFRGAGVDGDVTTAFHRPESHILRPVSKNFDEQVIVETGR